MSSASTTRNVPNPTGGFYSMGQHTLSVPMELFKLNRERLCRALKAEKGENWEGGSVAKTKILWMSPHFRLCSWICCSSARKQWTGHLSGGQWRHGSHLPTRGILPLGIWSSWAGMVWRHWCWNWQDNPLHAKAALQVCRLVWAHWDIGGSQGEVGECLSLAQLINNINSCRYQVDCMEYVQVNSTEMTSRL